MPLTLLRSLPCMRLYLRGCWESHSLRSLPVIPIFLSSSERNLTCGRFGRIDLPATVDYLRSFRGRTQRWVSTFTQIQKLFVQTDLQLLCRRNWRCWACRSLPVVGSQGTWCSCRSWRLRGKLTIFVYPSHRNLTPTLSSSDTAFCVTIDILPLTPASSSIYALTLSWVLHSFARRGPGDPCNGGY